MTTGFLHIDGNEALGRAPAVPRHWLVAAIAVIVAQWTTWQGYGLGQTLAFFSVGGDIQGMFADGGTPYIVTAVFGLVVPMALIAGAALFCSRRFDGRSAKAIGLDGKTAPLALIWSFAGLVAATPTIASIVGSRADFDGFAEGFAVLTPATIVQAGAEEILFRGVILGALSARYGVRNGVLISALLFGLWHVQFGQPLFDMGIAFASTLIFGVTAAVITLHYANLGPALALHVVWNVSWYMGIAAYHSEHGFWLAWITGFHAPWTLADVTSGHLFRTLIAPLLLETFVIAAVCRGTIDRVFMGRRAAAV